MVWPLLCGVLLAAAGCWRGEVRGEVVVVVGGWVEGCGLVVVGGAESEPSADGSLRSAKGAEAK